MAENGKGALFKNQKRTKDSHPDYTGSFTLTRALLKAWEGAMEGDEHRVDLAAWIKEGKRGKFLSVSVSAPYEGERKSTPRPSVSEEDDAPF